MIVRAMPRPDVVGAKALRVAPIKEARWIRQPDF
jgi:hypothetical protein